MRPPDGSRIPENERNDYLRRLMTRRKGGGHQRERDAEDTRPRDRVA